MSGKYTNKKQLKKRWLILAATILCLIAVCALMVWLLIDPEPTPDGDTQPPVVSTLPNETTGETAPVRVEALEEVRIDLGRGLWITDVGKYTGMYMEDGSDEIVSGVTMIAVTNEGEHDIQYAEITMPMGAETAKFSLTTLPVGKTVILLEQSRMAYVPGDYTVATASNLAIFQTPLSLCEDRLRIQIMDGAINVINISDSDITGDIVIYYKNAAADVYYGGITYRVRIEGGLKTGEVKQIMASHFSDPGSAILFVTCGDS